MIKERAPQLSRVGEAELLNLFLNTGLNPWLEALAQSFCLNVPYNSPGRFNFDFNVLSFALANFASPMLAARSNLIRAAPAPPRDCETPMKRVLAAS